MEHSAAAIDPAGVNRLNPARPNEGYTSGVSWAAVIGGAFVAAALSVALLALGTGLGLSSISPWANSGASASTMGVATIIWLVVMHVIAFAMGGYLAGRLRTKWVDVHTDEVFFRDTAHGFLVWAVGLVILASFLASAASSILGGAVQAGVAGVAIGGGAAAAAIASNAGPGGSKIAGKENGDVNAYFVDMLLRPDSPSATDNDAALRTEAGRIFVKGLGQPQFPAADQAYLAKQIAARTGLSQPDAEKRVADIIAQAKKVESDAREAADKARKAAAHASLWVFLSLLIGAFCASYAATIGGKQRDHVTV